MMLPQNGGSYSVVGEDGVGSIFESLTYAVNGERDDSCIQIKTQTGQYRPRATSGDASTASC